MSCHVTIREGGYVAADISALVAEASHSILSTREKHAHRQTHAHSALREGPTGYTGPTGSNSQDTNAVWTPELGLQILTNSLTAAMNVIAPSCLRGLAVQLPNVSTVCVCVCVCACVCVLGDAFSIVSHDEEALPANSRIRSNCL